MKVLTSIQIKELDRYTIENEPIASIDLMERAARQIVKAIISRLGLETSIKVFAGPGNNGGDALAVARLMADLGFLVEAFLFNTGGKLSEDCQANRDRIAGMTGLVFHEITTQFNPPVLTENDLVIDGLFGSGLNKPLGGGFASLVKFINSTPADVVSIDIPSGLMCEDNGYNIRNHIIRATLTLTLQQPKLSFFFPEYQEFIGEYKILDIGLHPQGIEEANALYYVSEEEEMCKMLRKRNMFAHKGSMGHGLLIAGSYGVAGAAILGTKAALRAGLGKITLHTAARNNDIIQISVPEAIVRHDNDDYKFTTPCNPDSYQAVAIGPGIGTSKETAMALIEQIRRTQVPLVLDADALNILGEHRGWIQHLPQNSILTPHLKEMDRLNGNCIESYERLNKARDLATRQHVYIILKGAWTAVIFPNGDIYFNPTGNPGMATAGSGDVLTGIILGLLCQGYNQAEACRLGVYLHGLAGDYAAEKLGEESLCASDIIRYLPKAFKKLKSRES